MSWRLHLTNQTIQSLEILPGAKNAVLAAWMTRRRVFYFDLETGTRLDGPVIEAPPTPDTMTDAAWAEFVMTLKAPNGVFLPQVRLADRVIYQAADGAVRLYDYGSTGLSLHRDETQTPLAPVPSSGFMVVETDAALGVIAALDFEGRLHLFKGGESVGSFDLGLVLDSDSRPAISLTDGPVLCVTDGQRIVLVNKQDGSLKKTLIPHYPVGEIASAGEKETVLMTTDRDTNVIRVYQGEDFAITHQCHADDLLARAEQPQLIADLPPTRVILRSLRLGSKGVFAFTLAGVICVSALTEIKPIPTTFI